MLKLENAQVLKMKVLASIISVLFSFPSFGWLHCTNPETKEDFYLLVRGPAEKKEVWVLDDKLQFHPFDFLLENSLADAPAFKISFDRLQRKVFQQLGETPRYHALISHLTDEKFTWPVSVTERQDEPNDFTLLRSVLYERAVEWRAQQDQARDASNLGAQEAPAPPDEALVWKRSQDALQEATKSVQARAIRPAYPGTEPEEIPVPSESRLSKLPVVREGYGTEGLGGGYGGRGGYLMPHPPINATEGWIRMMERKGRNYWPSVYGRGR